MRIVGGFCFGWRNVADGLKEPAVVEPVGPFERGPFDVFAAAPRRLAMGNFGLVQAVGGLGQCVVVAITDAADRRLQARFGRALGVADRHVLRAAIAVMHQAVRTDRLAGMQRLLQSVEYEAGPRRGRGPPADDPAREYIDGISEQL